MRLFPFLALLLCIATSSYGNVEHPALAIYQQLKTGELIQTASVNGLVIQKDRVQITLTGKLSLGPAIAGDVRRAVFAGSGKVSVASPPASFERQNLKRLTGLSALETEFKSAVFVFTANPFGEAASSAMPGAEAEAQELSREFEPRLLRHTGVNASARLVQAIQNQEGDTFFLAQFDKGPQGRFTYLWDSLGRVPADTFDINAGEKGIIFAHHEPVSGNDMWLAFASLEDYEQRRVQYPDQFELISVGRYRMAVDVVQAGRRNLSVQAAR